MMARVEDYRGKRVHFIGIGGSSMSGLAGLLKEEGYIVTGSDRTRSHKTDALVEKGIPVTIGHEAESVQGVDLIIYSAAINEQNVERAEARRLGIPQLERCDLIGQLMEGVSSAIGISGTHGKTTTTAMMAQAFMRANADPTIHIGGELDFLGGSTRRGAGEDFICEACEFNASFLHFHPTIAVILNIDEDHLDFYRDIDHIEETFAKYAALVPADGWCVGLGDDFRVARVLEGAACNTMTYGFGENCAVRAENVEYDAFGRPVFDVVIEGKTVLKKAKLFVPGEHNLLDALAVFAVAHIRGLDLALVADALADFIGAHRRFELTSITDGVKIYTDYGHNPAEIKNALKNAKMQPQKTLWAVWQPHTYSRTKTLFNGFVETFDDADKLLITDICAARESDPGDINSEMLIAPLRARGVDAVLTPTFDDAEAYLRAHWQPGDVVISHGCGDIDLLNEQIALHGDSPKRD